MSADDHTPSSDPAPAPAPARRRRWLRRTLVAFAVLAALVASAVWLLGRQSTLQQLVARVAHASHGEIAISGVTGSLYSHMHIGHLVYRSKDGVVTADDIDIAWSPLQYFSEGIAISELHIASLTSHSTAPSKAATMPTSLAAPFRLNVADARLNQLTLIGFDGSRNVISDVRLQLSGDKASWHVEHASAQTVVGALQADVTLGATKPFALTGTATLTQSAASAGALPPATLALRVKGDLALVTLAAQGKSGAASGEALLSLAPFDAIILRAADIKARGIDPANFNATWPRADMSANVSARIAPDRKISGGFALLNHSQAGTLDEHRLPLRGFSGDIGGTLTAATIGHVLLDLGAAGQFHGSGDVQREAIDAGIASAAFKLHTDRFDLKGVSGGMNKTDIAGDITLTSAADKLTLAAALAQNGLRLDLRATLADALLKIEQARLLAKQGTIDITGQAGLKAHQPFTASASARHFDPSALGAFPVADLNADISASGQLSPAWQVAASFALKPSTLFKQPLSGKGKLDADARHISGVDATVALAQNTAQLSGSFGAPGEKLEWSVAAKQLSIVSGDLLGALNASGVVTGTMAAPRGSFTADAQGLGLASAKHPAPDSVLHAGGDVWLAATAGEQRHAELKISGSAARLNPAAFGAFPAGAINADFSGAARLTKDWRADLDLALKPPSTLSNAPLSGYARLAASATRLERADIDLHLGADSLQAKGGFGGARDRIDWKLDLPQLATLGPQFGGALHAAGALSGTIDKPAATLSLDGAGLRLPGAQQVRTLRGSATIGSVGAGAADNDAIVSDIAVAGYASSGLSIDSAHLQTSGTRAAHVIGLSANNKDFDAALRIKGGSNGGVWTGVIDTLQNRGRYALALQAPATLRIAGASGEGLAGLAHPQQIALANFTLKLPDGAIRIDSLEKDGAQWRSKGQAGGVPANYLAQMSDAWRDNVSSDMTLGAAWALNLRAAAPGGAPAIDGMLHVYREKGDVTVTGADVPLPLGLRQLDARVDVAGSALRMQLAMDGSRAGQARVDATAQLVDGRLAGDSPLKLAGSANMGSLAWLAPLSGQAGLEMDGTLKLAISGGGTIGAPLLNGDISGAQLVVNWADQGIKLRNGVLQATLAGDQLQLKKLYFDGSSGHAQAEGAIRFANAEATMQLALSADHLEVLARPDRTLVVSGSSTLTRDAKHFELDGKFRADRADIELASQDTPTLSDDVVIVGKDARSGATGKAAAPSMPLTIDVEADLGDNFKLKGKGIDAQLAGSVRIRVAERRPPRATGSIHVVTGTYAAYGQKLAIERGVINFTGAYDNPGLNILAVRKRPDDEPLSDTNVEAGVEVRGTALAPVARLVSTPAVSDSDKLAWLVLGHGMDSTSGNDTALLGAAAGALFGGGSGKLANSLGLDELGVGQATGTPTGTAAGLQTTVVTVGKRISSRAYLSFEQGASTATSLVKLRYKLNPRFTLQFQTGTNNALDVLYSWAFD
ncbi:translocation/assembly module TamB domain-containing protein [Rugamonas sp.]|uniref:translocation/assembly module TamB domain-containing protein n=1 Tax=Rugamonas sp. TaxID=1926287 RepID=UPI0025EC85B3|nr:translocation/assembly module TamB domain-containing protein [Rugamonas sp.]